MKLETGVRSEARPLGRIRPLPRKETGWQVYPGPVGPFRVGPQALHLHSEPENENARIMPSRGVPDKALSP